MKKSVKGGNSIGRRSHKILAIFFVLVFFVFLVNQIPLTKATFQDNTSLQQIAYDCGGLLNTTNGVYRMNQSVTAAGTCFTISVQNITLDCNGNTITYSTGGLANTYGIIASQFNITIKNCKVIDGNWTSSVTSRYGIYLNNLNNGTFYNNSVNASNSIGIYIITNVYNNNISFNNGTSNSGVGIYLNGISNNTLTSNIGISNSNSGIYILTSSGNVLINNNGTSVSGSGIYLNSASNNILTGNNGTSNVSAGIYLSTSSNNTFTGNKGTSDGGYGIWLSSSSNNTLINNNGTSNSGVGIYLYLNSNNNTLINNNGTSNSGGGIYLNSASNNTLTGNNWISLTGFGFYIYNSSLNNNITSNLGISNTSYGIYLNSASNNTLTGNNGTSNSNIGIYINNASNNTLTGNNGTSDVQFGIYIYNSSYNTLTSNKGVSNSNWGIYLLASLNNTFTNFSWTNYSYMYSYVSQKIDFLSSSIYSKLGQTCIPGNSSSVIISYQRADENLWQNLTINRTRDIYTLGDSITNGGTFGGKWQKSLDSYMGSDSFYHNFGRSSMVCAYSYDRYVQNVTNSSNATVVVFCGINDVSHLVPFENTTYYYEAMYDLSVERGQQIVFVNVGTLFLDNLNCSNINSLNSWLLNFTQFHNVPLVNFHSLMSNSTECYPNLTITSDGVHPNDYGYFLLGKLIWEQGFNSSIMFGLNKSLIHYDQGKTYNLRCTTADDNLFETYYTLPSSFTSGGGIIDNASTLNTTLTNITAKINESSYNSSSVYYDSTLINITSDTSNLEFNYNFSKYDFNFTSVSIDNETVGDKKFLSVWGIAEDGVVGTKSMKIYNANPSYNSVCVKDEENVTSISAACTDTNETKVLCDSNSHNGYVCTLSGTTLTITGLKHSGVMQMYQDVSVAAAEDNSGSGPGSFNPSNQTLENGYNANVAKDDKINFKFNNETKTILIEKVSADNVEFSIDSKDYSVQTNQTMKIDLNSDGYYDIQIFLKSVYLGRAILEVKLINEKIPAEEQASSQEQNKTENIPPEKKSNNYIWIFIAAGVLILAFVIRLLFLRRKK